VIFYSECLIPLAFLFNVSFSANVHDDGIDIDYEFLGMFDT